jgi:hypothetical protein
MLTDKLCTIAITKYNNIFRVAVEIAKIKKFDPQYFPFNICFRNKTDSTPTLILFEPALKVPVDIYSVPLLRNDNETLSDTREVLLEYISFQFFSLLQKIHINIAFKL